LEWWLVIVVTRGWLWSGEEVGWSWCHGVVVVGEMTCGGVHSVDIEKGIQKNLFFCFQVQWVPFLTVVAYIDLPGAVQVICSARERVWRYFLVTWRWGGRDLPGVCLRTLGWFL
jgi:hypothetical protein